MKSRLIAVMIGTIMLLTSCIYDSAVSLDDESDTALTTDVNVNNPSNKITSLSLQDVIDSPNIKNGDVIDLSQTEYLNISDYKATINKSVTIKNGNVRNGALSIVADNVVLNNVHQASVTTQSSMKITGSTLNSLSIAKVSSPNANMVISRNGTSAEASNSGSSKPPIVEVDKTEVANDVSVGIANAYLTVKEFTAKKKVSLDAANVQLTINDTDTNISQITTDQICQVILEAGTSDTIPIPDVTGDGELKQINMQAVGAMKLLALTPMSGLTNVMKKDESIDFSSVVVLGTYQADNGITLFKAGLSEDLTETFSKIEKNYIVKIGEHTVYPPNPSEPYNWSELTVGTHEHTGTIDSTYTPKENFTPYSFDIVVIGAAENQTEIVIPSFELTEIVLNTANLLKTTYNVGEPLNMTGLIVEGIYQSTVGNISYKSIISDYVLDPPNGTILDSSNDTVIVKVAGATDKSIDITVNPVVKVTFKTNDDSNTPYDVQDIVQGEQAVKPTDPSKTGYSFDGWFEKTNGNYNDASYDFNTPVSEDIVLYAKWTIQSYIVSFDSNGGTEVSGQTVVYNEYAEEPTNDPTKANHRFEYWYKDNEAEAFDFENIPITETITLYAKWSPIAYNVVFNSNTDSPTTANQQIFCGNGTSLRPNDFVRSGYSFVRWCVSQYGFSKSYGDGDTVIDLTGDGGTVTLYAIWKDDNNGWDNSGDFKIGNVTCSKTALITVLNNATTIPETEGSSIFVAGRNVELQPYSIGKYEVTQQLYQEVMGTNPSWWKNAEARLYNDQYEVKNLRPAESMCWYDAIVFCNKLSLLMGKTPCYSVSGVDDWSNVSVPASYGQITDAWKNISCDWTANGYRLPTECEWECAARGGNPNAEEWLYQYSGSDTSCDAVAWYNPNGYGSTGSTWEVGFKTPNRLGIYDMSGNVSELCWDCYNEVLYSNTPWTGPTSYSNMRSVRFGSIDSSDTACKVSHRYSVAYPTTKNMSYQGFRLVCSGQ